MNIQEFFNKYNGQKIDVDGMYNNQCKDLFSLYNTEVVGNPNYVWGNAHAIYDAAPSEYYDKVDSPQKGDVVVWSTAYGTYGHIGIYWDGDINGTFRVFDQNNGGNLEPCQLTTYKSRSKITGFLRPNNESEENVNHEVIAETVRKVRRMVLTGEFDNAGCEADITWVENELNKGNKYAFEQLFGRYEKASNYIKTGDCTKYTKGINKIKSIVNNL